MKNTLYTVLLNNVNHLRLQVGRVMPLAQWS